MDKCFLYTRSQQVPRFNTEKIYQKYYEDKTAKLSLEFSL